MSALHQQQNFFYHCGHIRIATQMIGFKEITVCIAFGIAQMQKVDVIAQAFNHSHQIIIGTRTK
jgi:hypothetical protein